MPPGWASSKTIIKLPLDKVPILRYLSNVLLKSPVFTTSVLPPTTFWELSIWYIWRPSPFMVGEVLENTTTNLVGDILSIFG